MTPLLLSFVLVLPGAPNQEEPAPAAPEPSAPIVLGEGAHAWVWERDWLRLPEKMELGNTHGGICVDRAGRVWLNTDREHAIVVLAPDGELLRTFGAEWAGGLHGMTLAVERGPDGAEREVIWLAHTGRHEVAKTTLAGEGLLTLPFPEGSEAYASREEYKPTAVAVAPDGRVYVGDGYGKSLVHQYAPDGSWVRSFARLGTEPHQTRSPHGLLVDTRGETPRLLVCDRENRRLTAFTLDGEPLGVVAADLRRPCHVAERDGFLVIAELEGRVTILGPDDAVVTHLGAQPRPELRARNSVPRELWKPGEFLAPHSACWSAHGDLYVVDWLAPGRLTKLTRR